MDHIYYVRCVILRISKTQPLNEIQYLAQNTISIKPCILWLNMYTQCKMFGIDIDTAAAAAVDDDAAIAFAIALTKLLLLPKQAASEKCFVRNLH